MKKAKKEKKMDGKERDSCQREREREKRGELIAMDP